MKLLLRVQKDALHHCNTAGWTALHQAAFHGHNGVIEILLKASKGMVVQIFMFENISIEEKENSINFFWKHKHKAISFLIPLITFE